VKSIQVEDADKTRHGKLTFFKKKTNRNDEDSSEETNDYQSPTKVKKEGENE
jgi:hypothetical protein